MDNIELERRLIELDFRPEVNNDHSNSALIEAVDGLLNNGRVSVRSYWSQARRVLAAKQLVCRIDQIEVGSIDGLYGPQTAFAFEVYAASLAGLGPVVVDQRDDAGAGPGGPSIHWPRQREVESFYGTKGVNQVRLHLPYTMQLAWDLRRPINSFFVHEKVHDSALRCFERIADAYDAEQRTQIGIDLFGGCLNVRRMRGGSAWSMHSWGIAIDFDPTRNPLRSTRASARLAQPDCERFWRIWEDEGWLSLGRARDFDWMHVQAATL